MHGVGHTLTESIAEEVDAFMIPYRGGKDALLFDSAVHGARSPLRLGKELRKEHLKGTETNHNVHELRKKDIGPTEKKKRYN